MLKPLSICLLILLPALGHSDGIIRHDRSDKLYRQLAQSPEYDAVLALEANDQVIGSSVLISARWVLTAKHVLKGTSADHFFVKVGEGTVGVDRTVFHETADLALLHLGQPVIEILPASVYSGDDELGTEVTSVGFGISGNGAETMRTIWNRPEAKPGIKRAGRNIIDEIKQEHILLSDFDHPEDERYNMMGSSKAVDLEYLPMSGDSGGGLFAEFDGTTYLVGTTVAGKAGKDVTGVGDFNESLAYGWIGQWYRLSTMNDWIESITR